MKVIAYSVQPFEKEFLARANQKKHDITLISNPLNLETALFADGKEAVLIFTCDDVPAPVIKQLAAMGIRYLATRSAATDHIDKQAAGMYGIKLANAPLKSLFPEEDLSAEAFQQIAYQTIRNLDLWQQDKCVGKACICANNCRDNIKTVMPLKIL